MDCDQMRGPERADIQAKWYLPYEFDFRKEFGNMIIVFGGLLALLAFIVGASIVGAEWHHGGMMNLLLWRPRRMPVLATKLGVLLGGIGAVGIVLGALWTLAFWLIGRYDGTLGGMTAGVWRSMALDGARGIGLALAIGAVGFGLASIGRHTAMALGAVVGIGIISEVGTRLVLGMMRVQFPDRYSLSSYAMAWFEKELKLADYNGCDWSVGQCTPPEFVITWQDSALVFGVGTAIVLAAAFWLVRRRDVT